MSSRLVLTLLFAACVGCSGKSDQTVARSGGSDPVAPISVEAPPDPITPEATGFMPTPSYVGFAKVKNLLTGLALTVSPGAASSFTLSAASATPAAGASDNLTLTAKDAFGNVATSHSGSKSIVFSGAEASPSG